MTSTEFAFGSTQMPMNTAFCPEKRTSRVVIFRAENHVGDVAQPNECALVLADDELLEMLGRMQIGVRGQIDLKQRTFGAADRGEKIVSRKRVANFAPG